MITLLTPENFEAETKEGTVVVKFSTKNGCRFCDEFKPIYETASEAQNGIKYCEYSREALPQKESDLDEIERKYKIQSFPTILMFENGENKWSVQKYKFNSDRVLAGMILDEQKKLYNQQCFVEDLQTEMNRRRPLNPADELRDFPLAPKPPLWTKK